MASNENWLEHLSFLSFFLSFVKVSEWVWWVERVYMHVYEYKCSFILEYYYLSYFICVYLLVAVLILWYLWCIQWLATQKPIVSNKLLTNYTEKVKEREKREKIYSMNRNVTTEMRYLSSIDVVFSYIVIVCVCVCARISCDIWWRTLVSHIK